MTELARTQVICTHCYYDNTMDQVTDPTGWRCGHCGRETLIRRPYVEPAGRGEIVGATLGAIIGGMLLIVVGMVIGAVIGFYIGRAVDRWSARRKSAR